MSHAGGGMGDDRDCPSKSVNTQSSVSDIVVLLSMSSRGHDCCKVGQVLHSMEG